MTTQSLPNMGVPAGKPRPGSISQLCPDPNIPLEVVLLEWQPRDAYNRILPKDDRHLAIAWTVGERSGTAAWVLLHVLQERGIGHLTNWGPMTKFETEGTRTAARFSLGTHNLQTRNLLKDIARAMPVQVPDGVYNCQHWVSHVLGRAVENGVLSQAAVSAAWGAYQRAA